MYPVEVKNATVQYILEIKDNLIASGLVMHKDFEWRYHQSTFEPRTGVCPARAVFEFTNPVLASFYALKWGQS